MRLPRFTTRRLMIAVAVAGVPFGVAMEIARVGRLSHVYQTRAIEHAKGEWNWREMAADTGCLTPVNEGYRSRARTELKVAEYHAAMARKYRDAARRPWLPLTPDPPEPSEIGEHRAMLRRLARLLAEWPERQEANQTVRPPGFAGQTAEP